VDSTIKKLIERISQLKSLRRRERILILACAGTNSLGISGDDWDQKPWLLPCINGVLLLRGEEVLFKDGSPDDYMKTVVPTEWLDINAKAPLWKKP